MLRRIKAIAWKEWIHIIRDFRTLYLALILPMIMILLFGYAINLDIDRIPIGIADQDGSPSSRELVSRISAGDWFHIAFFNANPDFLTDRMDRGEIKIVVVIPPGFGRMIRRNETSPFEVLVDGSDNNAATIGVNYLEIFFSSYRESFLRDTMDRIGMQEPGGIRPVPRVLFNPELKSRYYILPGIIVLIIAIMSALLTSIVIAREWERGTMEQLISTPLRSHEIIIGKILPYIALSLFQVALSVALSVFLFDIPFRGSLLSLLFTSLLFATGALGLGILLSTVLKSQLPAMQVAIIASMLPSLFLSNFFFPIDSMPPVVRMITYVVPAKYYLVMLRTIFLKGSGFGAYTTEILFLSGFSMLILTIASKRLVKRVA